MSYLDMLYLTRHYRHRAESMRSVDDLLGSLYESLVTNGEIDHTVVIFTSDNGFLHGEHRLSEKGFAFEEAIRVPLFIRLPGEIGGESIVQDVINNDLAPTIAELASVSVGHAVDGRSIISLFDQVPVGWRRQFLIEHYAGWLHPTYVPTYSAVRTQPNGQAAGSLVFIDYLDAKHTNEYYDLGFNPYQRYSLHNVSELQGQAGVFERFLDIFKVCKDVGCMSLEDYDISGAVLTESEKQ